ncbi:MAG: class I SAM-dependent methyltransferase [Actinomycetota bacterium]
MSESPTTDSHTHDHDHDGPIRPEDVDWDERYRTEDQVWSGHVNGSLVDEVADHAPGRALDVGCGEGADAIWLAERGWTVTAVDIAPTAIERGRNEATRRELTVDWIAADLLTDPPAGEFDLVSLQYPAFAIARRDEVTQTLNDALAPGGLLLLVGHAFPEDPDAIPFDPTDWVQPSDVIAALPDGFEVELDEVRPRPGAHHHHAGSPHVEDVVVRIVRR